MSFRIPESCCPYCRAEITAAWHDDGAIPRSHDLTLCASCGSWLVFDDSLHVHKPSALDEERLARSVEAQNLQRLWVRFMREKKGARTQ